MRFAAHASGRMETVGGAQGARVLTTTIAAFADELSAHRYLEVLLWPNGPVCPSRGAGGRRVGKLDGASTRIGAHKCYACRKVFSIVYGTLFEKSHVPLHKWLQAIYLTNGGATPVRPYHLAQIINVSSKTATNMLKKLDDAAHGKSSASVRKSSRAIFREL